MGSIERGSGINRLGQVMGSLMFGQETQWETIESLALHQSGNMVCIYFR